MNDDRGRERRIVVAVAVAFVLVRLAVASLSSFPFHQGWNEAHYALIGEGFLHHPLVPRYGDLTVYNVPPLFPYLVAGSFALFGESVLAARLPSIFAGGVTIVATYALGRSVYDDRRVATFGACLLVVLPQFAVYAGRAQTDVLMTALFTLALVFIHEGYTRTGGQRASYRYLAGGGMAFAGALAAKQPALILPGVVLAWLVLTRGVDGDSFRRTGVLVAAGAVALVPLGVWFYLNFQMNPSAFVADWTNELFHRTRPFANVGLLVAVGAALGMTPFVVGAAALEASAGLRDAASTKLGSLQSGLLGERGPTVVGLWLGLYGAFVLYRTPHGHSYYAVALAPVVALLAARGTFRVADAYGDSVRANYPARVVIAALVLASAVSGVVVFYELSGEASVAEGGGERLSAEAGSYLATHVESDATVLVLRHYGPQMRWYLRDTLPLDRVVYYDTGALTRGDVREYRSRTGPLYVVSPDPTWAGESPVTGEPVYTTAPYDFTVMDAVGRVVATGSKFTYYLNDRRLEVYRYE